ncbi:unnamed protein product [Rotaria sp. Silwood1]|nr:unnamed protein product [Rotaria sp. Silwood1]CAF1211935.1 unnamed protein product [Rotaria sp. Silwood1]CAF1234992.1 unnamed protein product [Rotaria sp. Silwood1]CAF3464755.1 unnamed protein product [Rotaria sp. Silwood1]CAF3479955.1 unnamed protein product [Rotaria sp. Silwood1]
MLVTSSQSSTQRPLGLSVEELFALDRQYRRIEQQQHLAQLQNQARVTSSNLNRLNSRSLDLISSTNPHLTVLPSLEVHGHGYTHRLQPPSPSVVNYARSHSIDQLRYTPPVFSTSSSQLLKPTYNQRSIINDTVQQNYYSKNRTNLQHPLMATGTPPSLGNNVMYGIPPSSNDHNDIRNSCKLRRQQPIKRESSRRIVVRPVVQRRREPSISSSCESLDELRSPTTTTTRQIPTEQSNISNQSVLFTPSSLLTTNIMDESKKKTNNLIRSSSNNDSLSDDSDINLYEMRVPIGKTYDTSDISVQLEGPKILIHCHTIEPTDKRGNYRKHEFKTELLVPDVVDDETIVAYLTEDGQLIVEGKYQPWAWEEIKRKRKIEQQELKSSSSAFLQQNSTLPSPSPSVSVPSTNSTLASTRNDGGRIETLNNNRTVVHIGEPPSSSSSQQCTDTKSVSDIINRFNTLNTMPKPTIWDGQYTFTNDIPPLLIYHLRLPFETLMDSIRIQSDPELNLLKIFIEQQERNLLPQYEQQQQNKIIIRSTSRFCRLPRDHTYDYTHLRVIFLKDNFIRIELPTIN